jgi:hypothetical protein
VLRYFDLEEKVSMLSKLSNNFISVIFDCCREELPRRDNRNIHDADDQKNLTDQNLFIVFGCPPRKGVLAKSNVANNYIACISEYLTQTGGVLELPAALEFKFKARFEQTSSVRSEVTK